MSQIQSLPATQNDRQILSTFGIDQTEIIHRNGRYWLTAEQIGTALGYSEPRIAIVKLFNRNFAELTEYHSVTSLVTEAGKRETTVFNTDGAMLITMMARTPRAAMFRRQVLAMLKRWEAGEFVHISVVRKMEAELAEVRIYRAIAASPVMTDAKYKSLIRYRAMGLSAREISLLLGCGKTTVLRFTRLDHHFGGSTGMIRIGGAA
jgi:hypothetical protein